MAKSAWLNAIDSCLSDGILSAEEEAGLVQIAQSIGVQRDEMERAGVIQKVAMGRALRDILVYGRIPVQRPPLPPGVFLNLQKNEELVWCFSGVRFAEEVSQRHFVAGSSGVSFRVAKGVYYRVGGIKGHSYTTQQTQVTDTGTLGITTKHLYFAGSRKSFRIPHNKIVSYQPFSDALGFVKDGANQKLSYLLVNDGWFIYNLVMNVPQLAP